MIFIKESLVLLSFWMLVTGVNAQQVSITVDCSEAEQALSILEKIKAQQPVTDSDWNTLTNTIPYQALQQREASVHHVFGNDEFKRFIASKELMAKAASLQQTLKTWQNANIQAIANAILAYLPPGAMIHTRVFIVIKPWPNSFVWGKPGGDKTIFLYLNPALSKEQFENKVAHECHHIGMESIDSLQEKMLSSLSDKQKKAVQWLGGFGEGEAMLAAAGSWHIHPHMADDSAAKKQWDNDMAHFNRDLDSLQQFYENILNGSLNTDADIENAASKFWAAQGPWYTVGYRMAQLVEQYFGRKVLVQCYSDQRKLLAKYNEAAQKENAKGNNLRLWSTVFLQKMMG